MFNHPKFIIRQPQHATHQFRCADELGCHHAYGRDPETFSGDCVMQTARRATTSIANTRDDRIPSGNFVDNGGVRRGTVVRFHPEYHVRYAIIFL